MKMAGDFFLPVKARQRLHFFFQFVTLDIVWFEEIALDFKLYTFEL